MIDHREERERSYRVRRQVGDVGYAVTRRQVGDIPAGTTCRVVNSNAGFRGIEAWATAPDGTKASASLGAFDAVTAP